MDYEEYKRKALDPIVNYIESAMASYSKEEIEARIKKALPEKESEDEKIRQALIRFFKNTHDWVNLKYDGDEIVAYLERQKEQKPIGTNFRTAVKNLMNLHKIKNEFTEEDYDFHAKELLELVEQKEQKPAEWSEEDEKMLDAMVDIVANSLYEPLCPRDKMLCRLKSLRPQPHWKPSEEQMSNLSSAISGDAFTYTILSSLYEDLKKL